MRARFDQKTMAPMVLSGKPELLCDDAVTAIHQGSGGLLRRANALSRRAHQVTSAARSAI